MVDSGKDFRSFIPGLFWSSILFLLLVPLPAPASRAKGSPSWRGLWTCRLLRSPRFRAPLGSPNRSEPPWRRAKQTGRFSDPDAPACLLLSSQSHGERAFRSSLHLGAVAADSDPDRDSNVCGSEWAASPRSTAKLFLTRRSPRKNSAGSLSRERYLPHRMLLSEPGGRVISRSP